MVDGDYEWSVSAFVTAGQVLHTYNCAAEFRTRPYMCYQTMPLAKTFISTKRVASGTYVAVGPATHEFVVVALVAMVADTQTHGFG